MGLARRILKAELSVHALRAQLDSARGQMWREATARTRAEADRDIARRDLADALLERDVLAGYAATLEAELADQIPGRGWHPSMGDPS